MKSRLLIISSVIILLLFPTMVIAELHGDIEAGYENIYNLYTLSTNIEYGINVKSLYPYVHGGWSTLVGFQEIDTWLPHVQVYSIGCGLRFRNSIEIMYNHFCMHPVDLQRELLFDYKDFIFQSEDKFSVKISW